MSTLLCRALSYDNAEGCFSFPNLASFRNRRPQGWRGGYCWSCSHVDQDLRIWNPDAGVRILAIPWFLTTIKCQPRRRLSRTQAASRLQLTAGAPTCRGAKYSQGGSGGFDSEPGGLPWMNEGIHLDLDTWIVPGLICKANLCRRSPMNEHK